MSKILVIENLEKFLTSCDGRFLHKDTPGKSTIILGTQEDTTGYDVEIPWLEINSDGIVTAAGTHRHTIPHIFNADACGNITIYTKNIN